MRLLVNSLKYGLVSSRYYLIHKVLLLFQFSFILDTTTPIKITCSCWFAIIFSFSLKTVFNISIYSLFNCSNYFVFGLFSFLGYLGFFRPHTHCWNVFLYKNSRLYIYNIYIYIIYIYNTVISLELSVIITAANIYNCTVTKSSHNNYTPMYSWRVFYLLLNFRHANQDLLRMF